MKTIDKNKFKYAKVDSPEALGEAIRKFRKSRGQPISIVAGLSNTSPRCISELERGKDTTRVGKVLDLMNSLGLEMYVIPRGYDSERVDIVLNSTEDEDV